MSADKKAEVNEVEVKQVQENNKKPNKNKRDDKPSIWMYIKATFNVIVKGIKKHPIYASLILLVMIALIAFGVIFFTTEREEVKEQSVADFLQVANTDKINDMDEIVINEASRIIQYELDDVTYAVHYPLGDFLTRNQDIIEKFTDDKMKIQQPSAFNIELVMKVGYILFILIFVTYLLRALGVMSDMEIEVIENEKTRFTDIAGYDHIVNELKFLVEEINDKKLRKEILSRGGILLEGPPGNGKTFLAKAIAGEIKAPFIPFSASDLEDKYIGSGSRRVGKLFKKAKKMAKKHGLCVLFLDEFDAVAVKREKRTVVETNQTLNKLLTELDGFDKNTNVLVIASTNLVSSLDEAAIRSGRFDQVIKIPRPSHKDRLAVLNLYIDKLDKEEKVEKSVLETKFTEVLSHQTEGFSNADLDNLVKTAYKIARRNKTLITNADLRKAYTEIVAGLETKNDKISIQERKIIAYHEAGHAVARIALSPLKESSVGFITVIGYGESLGHVAPINEDKVLYTRNEILNGIKILLAGRAVEKVLLKGDYTTGASNDIEKVRKRLLDFIVIYGMNEKYESLAFTQEELKNSSQLILDECNEILKQLIKETDELIEKHYDAVIKIAEYLLLNDSIDKVQLPDIIKGTSLSA